MREGGSWFDDAKRFFREVTGELVFHYDANFSEAPITKMKDSGTASWRKNPDGSITIGKEQILRAIESAKAFKDRGRGIAENTQTAIGLSLVYIRKHFPEALNDVGYRE